MNENILSDLIIWTTLILEDVASSGKSRFTFDMDCILKILLPICSLLRDKFNS